MTDNPKEYQGGCFCGAVRYRFLGAPNWSAHCHCRSCQKATGAAFTTWIGLKQTAFDIVKGRLTIYQSSAGVERGFCGNCGTSLTYKAEERWPGEISVLAPTLDDPAVISPAAHVYVEHQLPWIKIKDCLPTHAQD